MFHADNFFYYFEDPSGTVIDYKKGLKLSLKTVIDEYKAKGGVLESMKSFPDKLERIEDSIQSRYMLKPLFFTFYGYIEKFGTGGSGFRNFYRDYLKETGKILNNQELTDAADYVNEACVKWSELAAEFNDISNNIGSKKDKSSRAEMYRKAASKAREMYGAEKKMLEKFCELYDKI